MTISEIKSRTEQSSPYFFSPKTLRFFGQTMSKFRIKKQSDGRYYIYCPMVDRLTGRKVGMTERYFNPFTNTLEHN